MSGGFIILFLVGSLALGLFGLVMFWILRQT